MPNAQPRSDPARITPFLTHVVTHHGQLTLIPPQNAGRIRKSGSGKPSASERRRRDDNEPRFNTAVPARRSQTTSSRVNRRGAAQRPPIDSDIPDYPPPSFAEAINSPPFPLLPDMAASLPPTTPAVPAIEVSRVDSELCHAADSSRVSPTVSVSSPSPSGAEIDDDNDDSTSSSDLSIELLSLEPSPILEPEPRRHQNAAKAKTFFRSRNDSDITTKRGGATLSPLASSAAAALEAQARCTHCGSLTRIDCSLSSDYAEETPSSPRWKRLLAIQPHQHQQPHSQHHPYRHQYHHDHKSPASSIPSSPLASSPPTSPVSGTGFPITNPWASTVTLSLSNLRKEHSPVRKLFHVGKAKGKERERDPRDHGRTPPRGEELDTWEIVDRTDTASGSAAGSSTAIANVDNQNGSSQAQAGLPASGREREHRLKLQHSTPFLKRSLRQATPSLPSGPSLAQLSSGASTSASASISAAASASVSTLLSAPPSSVAATQYDLPPGSPRSLYHSHSQSQAQSQRENWAGRARRPPPPPPPPRSPLRKTTQSLRASPSIVQRYDETDESDTADSGDRDGDVTPLSAQSSVVPSPDLESQSQSQSQVAHAQGTATLGPAAVSTSPTSLITGSSSVPAPVENTVISVRTQPAPCTPTGTVLPLPHVLHPPTTPTTPRLSPSPSPSSSPSAVTTPTTPSPSRHYPGRPLPQPPSVPSPFGTPIALAFPLVVSGAGGPGVPVEKPLVPIGGGAGLRSGVAAGVVSSPSGNVAGLPSVALGSSIGPSGPSNDAHMAPTTPVATPANVPPPNTSEVSPPAQFSQVTDLDVLVSRLDEGDEEGRQYDNLLLVSEIAGPADSATEPAAVEQQAQPLVGRVELQRRRVMKDGRVKLKLSLLGVAVDTCGICLSQFKDGDTAALGATCQHSFHEICLRRWLVRSRACPLCRAMIGAPAA